MQQPQGCTRCIFTRDGRDELMSERFLFIYSVVDSEGLLFGTSREGGDQGEAQQYLPPSAVR